MRRKHVICKECGEEVKHKRKAHYAKEHPKVKVEGSIKKYFNAPELPEKEKKTTKKSKKSKGSKKESKKEEAEDKKNGNGKSETKTEEKKEASP